MTTDQMRCWLAEKYVGPKWRLKCQMMPERQVIALYKSMSKRPNKKKKPEPGVKYAIQLSIFDLPEFRGQMKGVN